MYFAHFYTSHSHGISFYLLGDSPQSGWGTQTFSPGAGFMLQAGSANLTPGHWEHLDFLNVREPSHIAQAARHGEAFLLVQSSVGGKGGDWGGQCFQFPRPSHCARLSRRSSRRAASSSLLDRRNRWSTWGRDGGWLSKKICTPPKKCV